MFESEFTIQDDFPPVGYQEWRALAERDLEGASFEEKLVTRTSEGIRIQPLYTCNDQPGGGEPNGCPGLPPFVRGARPLGAVQTGWDLRQEYAHPDLAVNNRAILDDLRGGVTSLLLKLDTAARNGWDPDDAAAELAGHDGMMAYRVDDLDAALANVPLDEVGVALEAGATFLPAAAILVALWRRRHIALERACGAFNADPIGTLAGDGQLPMAIETAWSMLADLAQWTDSNCPRITSVCVDTAPYHETGATGVQDIAFSLATAVEYLRAMTGGGVSVDSAARQILFRFSLGTHPFLDISKLRAARRLWSRVIEVSGGSAAAGAMRTHTTMSRRVLSRRDPHKNMLRNTVAVFAAGIGGADVITSAPCDAATGLPDDVSRRLARHTVLILQEEAHLGRVIDPPGGSWYLDWLTRELAAKAWEVFQAVERLGGMYAALQNGWVAEQIESASAQRKEDIAREMVDVGEEPLAHPPPDYAALRTARASQISAMRRGSESLAALSSSKEKTAAAVEAASQGATIGQLANALAFHARPPFPSLAGRRLRRSRDEKGFDGRE